MQAPTSNSPILCEEDTILELIRLKGVMSAKHAEWDTKATDTGSRILNSEHRLATAMSKFYKSLGGLAVAYGSPSVHDHSYHNLTKAQKALTSAKAKSRLTIEDETQLDNHESEVIFTVFARIAATRAEDSKIVDFEPCRTASKAYFGEFCSRVSGFLQVRMSCTHPDYTDQVEEEKQASMTILDNALIASSIHITCANGLPTPVRLGPVLD